MSLTAQQPKNNIARVAIQALSAALGGTQSLHTDSYDEALVPRRRKRPGIALRTQQIVAHETGVTNVADPLGGSPYVEWMTDEMERQAEEVFAHLDELGDGSILEGVYAGIDDGYFVSEIAEASYRFEREVNAGDRVIVGVNAFTDGNDDGEQNLLRVDAAVEELQLKRLAEVKQDRDDEAVATALDRVRRDAEDPITNLMPAFIEAVKASPPRARSSPPWSPCSARTSIRRSSDGAQHPDRPGEAGARRARPRPAGRDPACCATPLSRSSTSDSARRRRWSWPPPARRTPTPSASPFTTPATSPLAPRMVDALRDAGVDIPVIVGGIIRDEDVQTLTAAGVAAILGPGPGPGPGATDVRDAVTSPSLRGKVKQPSSS